MPLARNPALERMRSGEAALGMIVRLARSGDIAMIAGATGHDFVFLDIQHTAMSLETAAAISLAALGCGVTPIVRVVSCDDLNAARALDAGAMGICVPDIETAEQARRAVEICKFPPFGRRSVSAGYPAFGYRSVSGAEAAKSLNENTLLACMVETRKGVENAEAIAAVDGVDVLHIGCSDLLSDMGRPGEYGHPSVFAAIHRVLAACNKHGKFAGLGGDRDLQRQAKFIRDGGRFLTTNTDTAFLTEAAARKTDSLRQAIKQAT